MNKINSEDTILTVHELWNRLGECFAATESEYGEAVATLIAGFEPLLQWYTESTGEQPSNPYDKFTPSPELELPHGRIAELLFFRAEQRLEAVGVSPPLAFYREFARLLAFVAARDGDLADYFLEQFNVAEKRACY